MRLVGADPDPAVGFPVDHHADPASGGRVLLAVPVAPVGRRPGRRSGLLLVGLLIGLVGFAAGHATAAAGRGPTPSAAPGTPRALASSPLPATGPQLGTLVGVSPDALTVLQPSGTAVVIPLGPLTAVDPPRAEVWIRVPGSAAATATGPAPDVAPAP